MRARFASLVRWNPTIAVVALLVIVVTGLVSCSGGTSGGRGGTSVTNAALSAPSGTGPGNGSGSGSGTTGGSGGSGSGSGGSGSGSGSGSGGSGGSGSGSGGSGSGSGGSGGAVTGTSLAPDLEPSGGSVQTFTTDPSGQIDPNGAFFQSLGTNGRTCATCHQQNDGWSISAADVQARFNQATFDANGVASDPIFRTVDGSTCDQGVDLTTAAGRTQAFTLLTGKGLIRIHLAVPANAEFTVDSVVSPYACNETSPLSMYRRPLPTANLRFVSTLMWDGRESSALTLTQDITKATNPADLLANLAHQSVSATLIHAQGLATSPLTPDQQKAIVNFEMALSVAQSTDSAAGPLKTDVTSGGPAQIAATAQQFALGVNAPFSPGPFTKTIFTLFDSWANYPNDNTVDTQKASIARGQIVFNSKPVIISGVAGFNDVFTGNGPFPGSCGYCHNSPNVGNHSLAAPMNIGVADVGNPLNPLDISYLPVITLRNTTANPPTPATVQTTDPGVALVSGKWTDIGKVKVPILRGLAARAPYFHNGSAQTLSDVLTFYEFRFGVSFTPQERTDLIAFLSSL